jgi:ubiquinone/menaquinone biosynthesis C-methylase UbiE
MAHMPQQPKEHPSTYVMRGRSNEEEDLKRLDSQDRIFTAYMGGVLSEQSDPSTFQRVLDVGCGPGWWLIETARTYPTISLLAGIDIGSRMIEYAKAQAEAAGVSDRTQFQTGDALRMLEFPNDFFDLANQRLGMSYLRKWDWPKLLREYQRVTKPGGVIRITEGGGGAESNSPALTRLTELMVQAFYQAGHLFTPEPDGVINHLAEQMRKYGIEQVQTKTHAIAVHKDPQNKEAYVEDLHRIFRLIAPFFKKWITFSDDYEQLYQQMVLETQKPDFEANITFVTAWGKRRKKIRI